MNKLFGEVLINGIKAVVTVVESLPVEDLRELLNQMEHWDTVGPFVDPTRWMQQRDQAHVNKQIIQALYDFRVRLGALRERATEAHGV